MEQEPSAIASPPIEGLTLRAAQVDDVDEVLDFWHLAAEDTDRPPDRGDAVAALIARDRDALMLAVHYGRIVGCLIAGWDGWRAHIYRLAVHPDYRRRGLASWLLTVAEQRLKAHGAMRIDAMVLDSNGSAHAVWSAADFKRQENWSRWTKPVMR